MSHLKPEAVKRPTKVNPQPTGLDADAGALTRDPRGDRGLIVFLQGAVGNHAVNRLMRSYGQQPAAWLAAARHAGSVQSPRIGASPSPGAAASVRRAPAAGPEHAPAQGENRDDYVDLLNGFEDLAIAADSPGGRGLHDVRFGRDLSAAHHDLLEQVQTALILAREHSPESRRHAIAMWPPLENRLRAALSDAGHLGIPTDQLAAIADNLSLVSEKYIHAPRHGPSQAENPDDYVDLITGIETLERVVGQEDLDKRDGIVPLDIQETNEKQRIALGNAQFGEHLSKRHRELLENLRAALILARTETPGSARAALSQWQSIQGELRHVWQRAPQFVNEDVGAIQKELDGIGEQLIRGGVYSEAHNEALKQTGLEDPDLVFQERRFVEAAEGFEEVNKLAEKGTQLAGQNVIDMVLSEGEFKGGMGHAIFELVKNPGEIHKQWEEFKEKGLIGKSVTAAELVEKTLALRNAVVKVSCEVVKRYADSALETAAHAGEAEAAKRWWKISDWAGEKLEMLEKVEKVGTVLAIAVSAVKIIDDIRRGKWGDALEEAATTSASLLATAAGGAGGAALVGGVLIVGAAEVEGIHGAAAMIRYCKQENVREAAMSFVDVCVSTANIGARSFVADARLLADPSSADEKDIIEKNLASYTPYWIRDLGDLSSQVQDNRPSSIGGQPALRDALGTDALRVLENPGTWGGSWQSMADQIRAVFAGANAMATYVVDHYSNGDKAEQKADEAEE